MSFTNNLCLPPPSPNQLARLAAEQRAPSPGLWEEDLFGEDIDHTSHTDMFSSANASNAVGLTVEHTEKRQNHANERVEYVTSSPEQGGPSIHSSNSPHTHNIQGTTMLTFDSTTGTGSTYPEPHASGSGPHNPYNLQTTTDEITFLVGDYQMNAMDQMNLDALATNNYMNYMYEHYQDQNHNDAVGDVNRLSHSPYTSQPMYPQVPESSGVMGDDYARNDIRMPLSTTQTQTALHAQAQGLDEDVPNDGTFPEYKRPKLQGYTGPLPYAPASLFSPHNAGVRNGPFTTGPTINNPALPAQTQPSAGVQLVDERLVYYDQFTGQMHYVPDKVIQNNTISLDEMTAESHPFHFHQLHYYTTARLALQPEFVEGNSKGSSLLDLTMNLGASEMSPGAIRPGNITNQPPVTLDGQQPIPSASFNDVFPTGSKRPRDEDGDTPHNIPSIPFRKRQYQGPAQPPIPSTPTTSQTIPRPVSNATSLEQRKLIHPYVSIGPNAYVCNYLGPAVPNKYHICGSLLLSGTRNRDRHLGKHGKAEEKLLEAGIIKHEEVHALLWVQKRTFECGISGCDFSVGVWRMDNVREKHEAEKHPELFGKKKGKGKG